MTEYDFIFGTAAADRAFATYFGLIFSALMFAASLLTLAWNGFAKRRKAKVAKRLPEHGRYYRVTGR